MPRESRIKVTNDDSLEKPRGIRSCNVMPYMDALYLIQRTIKRDEKRTDHAPLEQEALGIAKNDGFCFPFVAMETAENISRRAVVSSAPCVEHQHVVV